MIIVAIANAKGGVGKSTIATHLSYFLAKQKKKGGQYHSLTRSQNAYSVALIDADEQKSASKWIEGSFFAPFCEVHAVTADDKLFSTIQGLREKEIDLVIVDCPSGLGTVTRSAVMLADLVIIPSQPHFLDLDAVMRITNFLHQIRTVRPNQQPRASIFLNRCVARTLLSEESDDFLEKFCYQHNLIYFQTRIHQRQAIADSPNQKNFVLNDTLSKAKAEFEELCIEILGVLKTIWLEKDSHSTII